MGSTGPQFRVQEIQSDEQESGSVPRLMQMATQRMRKLRILYAWRVLGSQRVALVS
jgi:hypothetical protein